MTTNDNINMWAINRYNDDVRYLTENGMFPIVNKTIIKIDAVDDTNNDYKEKTGVHFMDEETLILGDENNNVYLVFEKIDKLLTTKNITKNVHAIDNYRYCQGSIIHKKHEVTPVPIYLKYIIINNTIINNFHSLNISNNQFDIHQLVQKNRSASASGGSAVILAYIAVKSRTSTHVSELERAEVSASSPRLNLNFLENNYTRGGMCPLVDMRQHPEWVPEYRKHVEVKRINICKSCRNRFIKG